LYVLLERVRNGPENDVFRHCFWPLNGITYAFYEIDLDVSSAGVSAGRTVENGGFSRHMVAVLNDAVRALMRRVRVDEIRRAIENVHCVSRGDTRRRGIPRILVTLRTALW